MRTHSLTFLLFIIISFVAITANAQQVRWVQYSGQLPAGTVYGGSENGQNLAICRCDYNGAKHPGKVVKGACNIGWGGKEVISRNFEILINVREKLSWSNVTTYMPQGAIKAGKEGNRNLYVGSAPYAGGMHPGKIFWTGSKFICNIGYGGKEITINSGFKVLVGSGADQTPQRTQATATSGVNCNYLVGVWKIYTQTAIVLQPDGSMTDLDKKSIGKWVCPKEGRCRLIWNDGNKQGLSIADSNTMNGTASNGANIQAVRMSDNDIKAYKEMMKYSKDMNNAMKDIKKFLKKD